jgi:hypothetical protein
MRPAAPILGSLIIAAAAVAEAGAAQPAVQRPQALMSFKPIKERDADRALREALTHAADYATARLGQPGGFERSSSWRVPLPEDLRSVRGNWNDVGRSGALERLQSAMNRAAEFSAPQARPSLHEAVDSLDFGDAVAIVRSGDKAASQFFSLRSRASVEAQMRPIVEANLSRAGAFAALDDAAAAAGAPARAAKYRAPVVETTLRRTVDALLGEMGAQESSLRASPERGSPLMRDVFSAYPDAKARPEG